MIDYQTSLAGVLPATAAALGCPGFAGRAPEWIGPARRAVVVLVDGLGFELLARRGGHAPFLRSQRPTTRRLISGFPSTTATSMGTFGTGLPPGSHGLVGYEVLDPATDRVLNELSWQDGPDPVAWQPFSTVFDALTADRVRTTMIGPAYFQGSGLTTAALRGARFRAARTLDERVTAAVEEVRAADRSLVYLYWGDLDKTGHVHGCDSWQWGDELESIDRSLARLAESVPTDTAVIITADHGMVDIPHEARVDVAHEPILRAGVRHLAGEPRAIQLYCEPGAAGEVAATWRERLGGDARVWTRDEIIGAGLLGPVEARVRDRVGEVVVTMTGQVAVVDSQTMRPEVLALLGLHGSTSADEVAIPLVVVPAVGPARA